MYIDVFDREFNKKKTKIHLVTENIRVTIRKWLSQHFDTGKEHKNAFPNNTTIKLGRGTCL